MHRVIKPLPTGVFTPPENCAIYDGLIDYLTREPPPAEALYVMELRGPGEFALVKPLPAEIPEPPHTFAGWPQLYRAE